MNNAKAANQAKALKNALPIVATAMGRSMGVKVQVGSDGSSAYTDGQTVVVPAVPDSFPASVVWGFLGHECAHVRYTDFNASWGRGVHKQLVNILEDCRIEQSLGKEYPGTIGDILSVCQYMVDQQYFGEVDAETSPAGILQMYALYHQRFKVLRQKPLEGHFQRAEKALEAVFPKGAQVRLKALLRKGANLGSTQEACDLATAILKMIEEEEEKERQQQQQGDQSQGDDDSDGSDSAQGDSGDDDDSDGSDSAQGDSGDDDDSDGSDSGQGDSGDDDGSDDGSNSGQDDDSGDDDGSDDGSDSGQGDDADSDGKGSSDSADSDQRSGSGSGSDDQDAADALKSILESSDDDAIQDAMDALRDEMQDAQDESGNRPSGPVEVPDAAYTQGYGDGASVMANASSASNRIRQELLSLVQASQRQAPRTKRRGKRIDANRLHRIVAGDTRVFRHNADKKAPNTAVHIVVDMSSSMGGYGVDSPYVVAREAALALALALEAIPGVNPAVSFFGGSSASNAIHVGLRHGERIQSGATDRFAVTPWGTTPMAEAIWYAGYELANTREERKLMMVLGDGGPNDGPATKYALDFFERRGVETIGVGIMDNAISHFIENSIVIHELDDLRGTLFDLVKQSLIAA